jgi:hypothetical protein
VKAGEGRAEEKEPSSVASPGSGSLAESAEVFIVKAYIGRPSQTEIPKVELHTN